MGYVFAVFAIGLAILVHEFGHFVAARWTGIAIRRFSIGFGPRIWGFSQGGTEFRIGLIPLGGYVLPAVKTDAEFFDIPMWKRILMVLSGPLANILLALLGFMVWNVMVSGVNIMNCLVTPFWQIFVMFGKLFDMFSQLIYHPQQLSGIIGTVVLGGQYVAGDGIRGIQFIIFISLNLAVFNLLPFPALDGGQIVFYLLGKLHPRLTRWQVPVAIGGWVVLMLIMVYAAILDIGRMIKI